MRPSTLRLPLGLAVCLWLALPGAALAGAPSEHGQIVTAIHGGTRPEVDRAISRLKNMGAPRDTLRVIARMLGEGSVRTRANAAYVFTLMPDPTFADVLIGVTQDESDVVRQSACTALGKMEARHAVPALLALLDDQSPVVRREAAKALGRIGDNRSAAKVAALLDDVNPDTRLAAILALGELQARGSEAKLVPLLKDPSETARLAAAKSLARLGNAQGRKVLDALLHSADPSERRDAVKLLEDVDQPWVREGLLGLMKEADLPLAIAAARALAGLGDGRGVEWLVHAAPRVAPEVRLKVETALEDLRLLPSDRKKILARKPSPGLVLPVVEAQP